MLWLSIIAAIVAAIVVISIAKRHGKSDAHFVTFADVKYAATLRRIQRQARAAFRPDRIHAMTERDLGPDYWNAHATFVRDNPRGFGYWTWKPYVVRKVLSGMREGEVLVYADAGSTIGSVARIKELASMDADVVAFYVPDKYDPREGRWTKREVLRAFGVDDEAMRASKQIMATAFFVRNTARSRSLIDEWYHACSRYALVDDSLTPDDQHPEFSENRHDQSIFSLLIKAAMPSGRIAVLEDEIETHRPCDAIRATRKKY
jgi:hypothetical protein